ncbi:TetR/AcrR family transcriptional regulator [Paenibacillus puerhi]|uniref:TetR/AcrR family transcriptional regulator n=1 Tax=Paenibacillus puerhi TaxID=2692622 RepID=UPI00135CE3E2|nr:TetR/AcrR family transcriptional regulator C-terminal domain-containing protein [Paenibacillus puerhi]
MTDRSNDDAVIPHYAKLAWKLQDTKPASASLSKRLNTYVVVKSAIELADRDGLVGLSIRNLAKHLGVTTMAIYRHILSREELLILMVDTALGPPSDSIRAAASWREMLRTWGRELFERYKAHPWLLDAPLPGLPTTPNHLQWIEAVLAGLEPTGYPLQQRLDIALMIDGHSRNMANLARQNEDWMSEAPNASIAWLQHYVTKNSHPLFSRALSEGVLEDEEAFNFDFGLDCIINGLDALP